MFPLRTFLVSIPVKNMGVEKARCDCEMTGLYLEKNKLIEIDCIVTEKS